MHEQLDMFSLYQTQTVKINKPIRLIELFAGIGAQAKAFENLGVEFEHYRAIEFDKYAMTSYNAIHGTAFEVTDIRNVTGKDLKIVDTDTYCYVMTYSFPCQDLSNAGLQAGMAKGSGTRSGLLWEVERLLMECKELADKELQYGLPQYLLLENVPALVGEKNKPDFDAWRNFLSNLGYTNHWELLNAKDFGIPQNRNRCFMISWLGGGWYEFPKPIELKKRLKDILQAPEEVDEKFYLSDEAVAGLIRAEDRPIDQL